MEKKKVLITVLFIDLKGEVLSIQCIWKRVLTTSLPISIAFRKVTKKGYCFALNR